MLRRGLASIWRPGAFGPQSCHNYAQAAAPAFSTTWARTSLHTSALGLEGKGPDAKNSPEQKKGVRTDPDMAPPKDDRQSTPSSKKTNELEKGAGAPAGKDALKSGEAPKKRGLFTAAWSSAGPADGDSPEQKKGVKTDPDIAPPKMDDDRQQTPSSKKTNELEKGAGAPSGDNHLKPGDKPKPGKGFHTSAGSWADDKKDTDAKDKDDTPDINRGPSGRPDDPHMQVDQAADDHPAPKAG